MFDAAAKERKRETEGRPKSGCEKPMENLPSVSISARDAVGQALGVCGKLVDAARVVNRSKRPEIIAAVDPSRRGATHRGGGRSTGRVASRIKKPRNVI